MEDSIFITGKTESSFNYKVGDRPLKKSREIRMRRLEESSSDETFASSNESWDKLQSNRPPEPKPIRPHESSQPSGSKYSRRSESIKAERSKRKKKSKSNDDCRIDRMRKNKKIPYFANEARERERLQGLHKKCGSPSTTERVETRTKSYTPYFADEAREKERLRRKYGLPEQKEKVPYYSDEIRERDRLRVKYKKSSPTTSRTRARKSRSHSLRRRSSRSRSRSRSHSPSSSRSRSRHRRSSTDRYQIIPYPVPVPDYSFAFPPFLPQRGWPRMSMPLQNANMMSYYSRQHYRNSDITSNNRVPPHLIPPPPPPHMAGYMPPFSLNGMPSFGPTPSMRPPNMGNRFRFQHL